MTEFRLFSASLISLRLADVGITFVVSPDLRWEANPLVSVAGLGWGALILANVAGVLLILFFYRYTLVSGGKFFPPKLGYSLREFVSHYLFGDRYSFRKIYYVVPYNKTAILQYCGYVGIRVITVWSLVVVMHNLCVWRWEAYRQVTAEAYLWLGIYGLLILLVVYYSIRFFTRLYAAYLWVSVRDEAG